MLDAVRSRLTLEPAGEADVEVVSAEELAGPIQGPEAGKRVEQHILALVRQERGDAAQPSAGRRGNDAGDPIDPGRCGDDPARLRVAGVLQLPAGPPPSPV